MNNMSKKLNLQERLVDNVSTYPNNLSAAFRLTARQAKVTVPQVQYLYYKANINGKREGVRGSIPMFMTQSIHGIALNTKTRGVLKETKRTLTLKGGLVELVGLTPEEKVSFFDLIFK